MSTDPSQQPGMSGQQTYYTTPPAGTQQPVYYATNQPAYYQAPQGVQPVYAQPVMYAQAPTVMPTHAVYVTLGSTFGQKFSLTGQTLFLA